MQHLALRDGHSSDAARGANVLALLRPLEWARRYGCVTTGNSAQWWSAAATRCSASSSSPAHASAARRWAQCAWCYGMRSSRTITTTFGEAIIKINQVILLNSTRSKLCEARNITCDGVQTASELIQDVIKFKETSKISWAIRSASGCRSRAGCSSSGRSRCAFVSSAFVVQSVRLRLGLKQALDKAAASSSQQQAAAVAEEPTAATRRAASTTRTAQLAASSSRQRRGEEPDQHAASSNNRPSFVRRRVGGRAGPFAGSRGWVRGGVLALGVPSRCGAAAQAPRGEYRVGERLRDGRRALQVFSTLERRPKESWYIVFADLLFSVVCKNLAIIWLRITSTGGDSTSTGLYMSDEQKSTSRYALEIDFYTGAFSFCVGWGYIVVLRDLSYLVAAATALLARTTEDNDAAVLVGRGHARDDRRTDLPRAVHRWRDRRAPRPPGEGPAAGSFARGDDTARAGQRALVVAVSMADVGGRRRLSE